MALNHNMAKYLNKKKQYISNGSVILNESSNGPTSPIVQHSEMNSNMKILKEKRMKMLKMGGNNIPTNTPSSGGVGPTISISKAVQDALQKNKRQNGQIKANGSASSSEEQSGSERPKQNGHTPNIKGNGKKVTTSTSRVNKPSNYDREVLGSDGDDDNEEEEIGIRLDIGENRIEDDDDEEEDFIQEFLKEKQARAHLNAIYTRSTIEVPEISHLSKRWKKYRDNTPEWIKTKDFPKERDEWKRPNKPMIIDDEMYDPKDVYILEESFTEKTKKISPTETRITRTTLRTVLTRMGKGKDVRSEKEKELDVLQDKIEQKIEDMIECSYITKTDRRSLEKRINATISQMGYTDDTVKALRVILKKLNDLEKRKEEEFQQRQQEEGTAGSSSRRKFVRSNSSNKVPIRKQMHHQLPDDYEEEELGDYGSDDDDDYTSNEDSDEGSDEDGNDDDDDDEEGEDNSSKEEDEEEQEVTNGISDDE